MTKPRTAILRYETPTGAEALTVYLDGQWGEGERFAYCGKLGAGSGHPWTHVVDTVAKLRRFHPRSMKLTMANVPAYKLP